MCRPEACNFITKETLAQVFSCEFCKISKNTFLTEQLRTTASAPSKSETQFEVKVSLDFKVNKSVYIAKSGERYKTLNNFLLHVSNHTLKDMHTLNYGILDHSSIEVLIDLINASLHYTFFISNFQSESCLTVTQFIFSPWSSNDFCHLVD